MDSWHVVLQNLMPSIAEWPVLAQSVAVILFLLFGTAALLSLILLTLFFLIRLNRIPVIASVAGSLGFLVVVAIGWAVCVLLPSLIEPNANDTIRWSGHVQSFGLFFAIFLLFALLGKDELDGLEQWPRDSSLPVISKLFDVSLLLLPVGIPLWLRIFRLRQIKKAKEEYAKILKSFSSDS